MIQPLGTDASTHAYKPIFNPTPQGIVQQADRVERIGRAHEVVLAGFPTAADLGVRHRMAGLSRNSVMHAGDIDLCGNCADEQALYRIAFRVRPFDEPWPAAAGIRGLQSERPASGQAVFDSAVDDFARAALITRIVLAAQLLGDMVRIEERIRQDRGKVLAPGAFAGAVGADHRQHPRNVGPDQIGAMAGRMPKGSRGDLLNPAFGQYPADASCGDAFALNRAVGELDPDMLRFAVTHAYEGLALGETHLPRIRQRCIEYSVEIRLRNHGAIIVPGRWQA